MVTKRPKHERAITTVLGTLLLVGCGPRIMSDHCLFWGGDRWCYGDESCFVVIGGGVIPGAYQGCVDISGEAPPDPEHFLHLEYGLPGTMNTEGDVFEADSVEGVLARASCSTLEDASAFEDQAATDLEIMFAARARLERLRRETRVRHEQAYLDATEAEAVASFNQRVRAWATASCEPESTDTSSGTDFDETSESTTTTTTTSEGPPPIEDGCVWEGCPSPAVPFCDVTSGECVACDAITDPNAACADDFPSTPLCIDGECVECTLAEPGRCSPNEICDEATHTCKECIAHDDCVDAGCNFASGKCLPADAVVRVGARQLFTTITQAVESFPLGASGTILIHEGTYSEAVAITQQRKLALLAADGSLPILQNPGVLGASQLTVVTGSMAFVQGLEIRGNANGAGVTLDGGAAWLDAARIVDNALGILLEDEAALTLRNCTVGTVTDSGDDAMWVDDSSATILYSTLLADNLASSLLCLGDASVVARNSILLDLGPLACAGADISYSATYGRVPGEGNHDVAPLFTSFETWFPEAALGNFHLGGAGAIDLADIARWRTSDPPVDLDGDPRPNIDDALDYPGADVPSP